MDLTESLGGVSYVYLLCDTGERLVIEERGDHRSRIGDRVGITIEARRVYLFDPKSETRIRH